MEKKYFMKNYLCVAVILTMLLIPSAGSFSGTGKIPVALVSKNVSLYGHAMSILSKKRFLSIYERRDLKSLVTEIEMRQSGLVKGFDSVRLKSVNYLVILSGTGSGVTSRIVRVKDGGIIGSWYGSVETVLDNTAERFESIAARINLSRIKSPDDGFEVEITPFGGKKVFKIGEPLKFFVESSDDGYLYVIDVQPGGDIQFMVPFSNVKNVKIRAGQRMTIPDDLNLTFTAGEPAGGDTVKVFVTKRPLEIHRLSGLSRGGVLPTVKRGRGESFSRGIVVSMQKLKSNEWGCAQVDVKIIR